MSTQANKLDERRIVSTMKTELNVHDWNKVDSAYLIGSFADPEKEIHDESDIDVMLIWDHVDSFVENQNEFDNGITGYSSARKWDNPMIETRDFGNRPLDVIEVDPLVGYDVPDFAIKLM